MSLNVVTQYKINEKYKQGKLTHDHQTGNLKIDGYMVKKIPKFLKVCSHHAIMRKSGEV